ncbi:hypothetical protein DFH08DRAFT_117751 [Mycena albidolilacea]|uniref:Uncharacterized protein n=1 Tax=Mycena albidolilacea TaxID=1033008 RepID=A0AAD7EUH2_9AGAR|nr:hypothetical protein DFH08DRAFT_117751 [Mycena albidolilacea]
MSAALAQEEEFVAALELFTGLRYFVGGRHDLDQSDCALAFQARLLHQQVSTTRGNLIRRVHFQRDSDQSEYSSGCRTFLWVYGVTVIIAGATSHSVIIIRIYGLWDHRPGMARILMGGFGVCISAMSILGIFSGIAMIPQLTFFEPLRTCQFGPTPRVLTGMMSVTSFFDFALVTLVLFNAIDRPRRTNIELISALERDGVGLFVTIFALRFSEVFISVFRPTSEVFVAVTTVWAFCTMINSRLHMRLESLTLARAQGVVILFDDIWSIHFLLNCNDF